MNSVDQAQTLVTTSLKVLQDPWLLSVSLRFWSVSVEMIRISSHPKSLLDLSDLDFRDLPPNYRHGGMTKRGRDRGPGIKHPAGQNPVAVWKSDIMAFIRIGIPAAVDAFRHRINDALIIERLEVGPSSRLWRHGTSETSIWRFTNHKEHLEISQKILMSHTVPYDSFMSNHVPWKWWWWWWWWWQRRWWRWWWCTDALYYSPGTNHARPTKPNYTSMVLFHSVFFSHPNPNWWRIWSISMAIGTMADDSHRQRKLITSVSAHKNTLVYRATLPCEQLATTVASFLSSFDFL